MLRRIVNNSTEAKDRLHSVTRGFDLIVSYYNYIKINPGISYTEFMNEDVQVVEVLFELEKLVHDKNNKTIKNHG